MFSILKKISKIGYPEWTSIFIWVIGIAVLIGLTIKDFCPLLDDYTKNNVATQIKIVAKNNSIKPPPISICIPYQNTALRNLVEKLYRKKGDCLVCESMANRSWDVWRELNLGLSQNDYTIDLSRAFMKKLLIDSQFDNFRVLSLENIDWNQPIIDSVWAHFNCIFNYDKYIDYKIDKGCVHERCRCDYEIESIVSNKSIIDSLYTKMIDIFCKYVSISHQRKYNANYICVDRFPKFTMTILSGRSCDSNCRQICFTLPKLMIDYKFFVISYPAKNDSYWEYDENLENSRMLQALHEPTCPFEIYSESDLASRSFSCSDGIKNYRSDQLNSDDVLQSYESINLKYNVQLKVKEGRPSQSCYTDDTPSECINNCVLKKIIDSCRCIPFTLRNIFNSSDFVALPYCTKIFYKNCPMNRSQEQKNCENRCTNPCEYISYQWQTVAAYVREFRTKRVREFWLNVESFVSPFIELTVVTKNTPEQFLSQIGALINLYLGFSGLSVIGLILFLAKGLKIWCEKRETRKSRMEIDTKLDAYPKRLWTNLSDHIDPNMEIKKLKQELMEENLNLQKKFNDELALIKNLIKRNQKY